MRFLIVRLHFLEQRNKSSVLKFDRFSPRDSSSYLVQAQNRGWESAPPADPEKVLSALSSSRNHSRASFRSSSRSTGSFLVEAEKRGKTSVAPYDVRDLNSPLLVCGVVLFILLLLFVVRKCVCACLCVRPL